VSVIRLLLFGLGLAGCAEPGQHATPGGAYDGPDQVSIPPVTVPRARMPANPLPAVFRLPEGKGPFPAVIVLHGCGGRGASQLIWAARLNAWGYAVLIPDSMTPRGVKRVCEPDKQPLVTPRDRVGDVGSAIVWLRARPDIDPRRIAVLGQSHGGATAVLATQRLYQGFGLRAAIDYYGACVDPAAHGDVPLLVLAGDQDDWGHPASRCSMYESQTRPAQLVEVHTYAGAYHAFENPQMTRMTINGHTMEYNQAAAEDSFGRVRRFLERHVRR